MKCIAVLEVFCDIKWGTDQVLKATLAKIKGLGLSVMLLETLRDIDTWDDIIAFSKLGLSNMQYRELNSFRFVRTSLGHLIDRSD